MNAPERATVRGIPGDSARRRGLKRILLPTAGFALAVGIGFGAVLGAAVPCALWGGLGLLVLSALLFGVYLRRQPALVYGFFKGARGEEMVAGELARLPADWTVFHGVVLPDGTDIDHLAVGPQGVFLIETKYWSGQVSVERGRILANGRPVNRSPVLQVRRAAAALSKATGLSAEHIRGMLCFAGTHFPEGSAWADEILVCSHVGLTDTLGGGARTLSDVDVARAVAKIGELTITEGL